MATENNARTKVVKPEGAQGSWWPFRLKRPQQGVKLHVGKDELTALEHAGESGFGDFDNTPKEAKNYAKTLSKTLGKNPGVKNCNLLGCDVPMDFAQNVKKSLNDMGHNVGVRILDKDKFGLQDQPTILEGNWKTKNFAFMSKSDS